MATARDLQFAKATDIFKVISGLCNEYGFTCKVSARSTLNTPYTNPELKSEKIKSKQPFIVTYSFNKHRSKIRCDVVYYTYLRSLSIFVVTDGLTRLYNYVEEYKHDEFEKLARNACLWMLLRSTQKS